MKTTVEVLKNNPIIILIKLKGLPLDCINKKEECISLIKKELSNTYNRYKKGFDVYGNYKISIEKNENLKQIIDLAHFVLVENIKF